MKRTARGSDIIIIIIIIIMPRCRPAVDRRAQASQEEAAAEPVWPHGPCIMQEVGRTHPGDGVEHVGLVVPPVERRLLRAHLLVELGQAEEVLGH